MVEDWVVEEDMVGEDMVVGEDTFQAVTESVDMVVVDRWLGMEVSAMDMEEGMKGGYAMA